MTLAQLAAAHGVATSYEDWSGAPVDVAPSAVVAALAALGVDADGDAAVAARSTTSSRRRGAACVPPTVVVRGGRGAVEVVVPDGADRRARARARGRQPARRAAGGSGRRAHRREPSGARCRSTDLPLGWHALQRRRPATRADDRAVARRARRRASALPPERAWGWMVQLYSLRSAGSWGIGDYADLRTVLDASAADGAGVVLLNPLHAETPVAPINPSPYSPSSRRFRSPLYLHVEDVPEHAAAPDDVRAAVDACGPRPTPTGSRATRRGPPSSRRSSCSGRCTASRTWPPGGRRRARRSRSSRCSARSPRCTACRGRTGRSRCAGPTAPACRGRARSTPSASPSGAGCSCSSTSSWPGLGSGMAGRASCTTSPSASTPAVPTPGRCRTCSRSAPPSAPRPTRSTSRARTGACRRGARTGSRRPATRRSATSCAASCGTPAGCASTTSWGCSGCGGCPAARPPPTAPTSRTTPTRCSPCSPSRPSRAGAVVVGEDLGTVEDRVREALDATGVLGSAVLWFETDDDGAFLPPSSLARGDARDRHDARPADGRRLPGRGAGAGARRARPARRAGRAGARDRPPPARGPARRCSSARACSSSATATCRSRCTRRSSPRPAGSCWPPSATPSATCASPTCRAPSTSTPTGGCPSPTAPGGRSRSRSCSRTRVCGDSPRCSRRASARRPTAVR